MFPRETLRILEKQNLSKADQDKIYYRIEAVTGRKLVKS